MSMTMCADSLGSPFTASQVFPTIAQETSGVESFVVDGQDEAEKERRRRKVCEPLYWLLRGERDRTSKEQVKLLLFGEEGRV